jgi:hypothetical protein
MVLFESDKKTGKESSVALADWADWQKANVFRDLAAVAFADYERTGVDQPLQLTGHQVPHLPNHGKVDIDWQTLAFSAGAALLTGLVFGFAPALEGPGASRFRKIRCTWRLRRSHRIR